jgi:hypothetical protein
MTTALAKTRPDKRSRITARLKVALDLMVWGDQTGKPLDYTEAGRTVNISARSMRRSLERPLVRQYLVQQGQVFRASLTPRSLWHLAEISAQRVNMNAAVAACRTVLGQDEAQSRSLNPESSPHMTIQIVNVQPSPAPAPVIEHSPLPELEAEPAPPHRDQSGRLVDADGRPVFDPYRDR